MRRASAGLCRTKSACFGGEEPAINRIGPAALSAPPNKSRQYRQHVNLAYPAAQMRKAFELGIFSGYPALRGKAFRAGRNSPASTRADNKSRKPN